MEYLQYFKTCEFQEIKPSVVLNLVISGIPSILYEGDDIKRINECFKPCYKWNTFNTMEHLKRHQQYLCFKPCYKWNTFNTLDFDKNTDFMVS